MAATAPVPAFWDALGWQASQAQRDQLLNEHFDAADKNRDSVLTLDEFAAAPSAVVVLVLDAARALDLAEDARQGAAGRG